MLRLKSAFQRTLLAMGDLAIFEGTLLLALVIRYGRLDWTTFQAHVGPFTALSLIWIVTFYVAGLYEIRTIRQPSKMLRTYLEAMFINFGLAIAFFYLIPNLGIEPRTNLFLHFCLSLALGYAWRLIYSKSVIAFVQAEQVLFMGKLSDAEQIKQLLSSSGLNVHLKAVITPSAEEVSQHHDASLTISSDPTELQKLVQTLNINLIVTDAFLKDSNFSTYLYQTLFWPVTVLDRAELEEVTTGRIPLEHVNDAWLLQNLHESEKALYESIKRVFDLVMAIPFGILTLMLLPFVAIITKLSSPGPVFIKQTRIGKNGQPFTLIKFRSMKVQSAGGLSEPNGPAFTADAKTDPRIFPFGRIIRRLRIDELPQIWNVLRGDLSLIGPRPERPEFVFPLLERMPYYALRHLTRPGLTGWAQVLYLKPNSSIDDNLVKLQYDLYYIKHRSLLLDASILLKTIGIVIKRQGT